VLGSSGDGRETAAAYARGANAFVTKPLDLDAILAAVREIAEFWRGVAATPRE
jgi:hypothetical protein